MERLFLSAYRFFKVRKPLFWTVFLAVVALMSWRASTLVLEEDITRFFPQDERVDKLNYVFQNSKLVERVVVMVSIRDSSVAPQPDSLVAFADSLAGRIAAQLKPYYTKITTRVEEDKILELFESIPQSLPVFLEEQDYHILDSLTRPENIPLVLEDNYRQLISPSGIVMKKIIAQDPMGFSFLALKKMQRLQYDETFELYDNYILTRDHRHLVFFIQPSHPPSETRYNSEFIEKLHAITENISTEHNQITASYFGALVVAVGNARQLRADTFLTVGIMLVLLMVVILGFFRKKRVPFLMMVPVVFGALFSLCCITFIQGSLSILALGVGAVILGIAVNYALHFLVGLRHSNNVEYVIKELTRPLTLGSTTTVLAFLCLQFTNAVILRDVGLFAGLSLVGAALCSLIFLPHLMPENLFRGQQHDTLIERITSFSFESNKYLVYGILILTPVFFYFAGQVTFNTDMRKLNFMKPETALAQKRLESLNKASLSSVYVVSDGTTLEEALRENEESMPALEKLKKQGLINKISSVSLFMLSDSLQRVRIERWRQFWNKDRTAVVLKAVHEESKKLRFSETVLQRFDSLVLRAYKPLDKSVTDAIRTTFFDDYIIEKNGMATVITMVNVSPANKERVYQALNYSPSHAFDRQMLTNLFVEYVHADFTFIITFTSILVFVALLISLGRIELTLITFVPMLFTWIWILGIMALAGIEFNIVNVMVSTFIFGLGDDYSIFIMDGLQQEYRADRKVLPSIRTSIFLSAVTTISGMGVLIFAEHPALRSIAAISIIGIVSVFIMAQTIEPFLFRVLISDRTKKGLPPMTAWGMLKTFMMYTFFVLGSFVLTIAGLLLKIVPASKEWKRLLYHRWIRFYTSAVITLGPNSSRTIINQTDETFSRASVIVSNHTSFLDILLTAMIHPRLILLTNKWVWNSPVFGGVVRLADYYPVMEGAEDSIDRLRDRVKEGYSVVVFPEGTRSPDGKIGRFHKGAFYIAEALKLPVRPLLIHGAKDGIRKGDIYLNNCTFTLKFLPPVEVEDTQFGETYSERTKKISRYFKEEYTTLARTCETPEYFRYWLISNYLYKGPVLEWYTRIKTSLEKNYAPFDALVPRKATVLDLGCGYGFLAYMLQFLSEERIITGVDFDEEKIETAQNGYLKSARLNFVCADVTQFPLQSYDVIIISDVLHYLTPVAQELLVTRCFSALNAGGKIIIRDGNADLQERHKGTKLTEFFSVKLLGFNKSSNALNFLSGDRLIQLAAQHGRSVKVQDDAKFTSNVIFVIE